jgi:pterin-4a-carbinolamine dehydratase
MSAENRTKIYQRAEIEMRLASDNPRWRFAEGALRRTYRTSGWRATLMVVNTIGHLAEAAWHHPEMTISYNRIDVGLSTHDASGITDRDFTLARKIEDVVLWRPTAALAPDAPVYIKED